ncbi:hypothetical protein B566_EDAN002077 [Ephemera danica]|nr:hypothetical protein B566_EDAN002077 [Ephemera danica]
MRSLQVTWILSTAVALSAAYGVFGIEDAEHNLPERSSNRYNTNMLELTPLNGKNYFFSIYQKMTFMDAMDFCLNFGMDLASVNTNQEQTIIDAYINSIEQSLVRLGVRIGEFLRVRGACCVHHIRVIHDYSGKYRGDSHYQYNTKSSIYFFNQLTVHDFI